MNNNDIFKKLRVALQLRDDQIVEILELVDFRISKAELGAFFRATDHPNYMECGDQVLRNFLNALIIHLRGTKEAPKNAMDVIQKNSEAVQQQQTERHATAEQDRPERTERPERTNEKKPAPKKAPAKGNSNNNNHKNKPRVKKPEPVVEKVKYNNGKKK